MSSEYRAKLIAELRECEALGEFVEVHKWDDDPTIFLVGVVTSVTSRTLAFDDVDTNGVIDDETVTPLANIVLIRRDTAYLRRLRKLHDDRMAEKAQLNPREAKRKSDLRAIAAEALESGEVVCVWFGDSKIYGLVKSLSKSHIELAELDETGFGEGRGLYRLKNIKRIRAGTIHEATMDYARQNPTPLGS